MIWKQTRTAWDLEVLDFLLRFVIVNSVWGASKFCVKIYILHYELCDTNISTAPDTDPDMFGCV